MQCRGELFMRSFGCYFGVYFCLLRNAGNKRKNSWWRHQMETFSALLTFCAGNSPVTDEFPTQSQWRGPLKFSLICVWNNSWVNNGDAGALRRHYAHYDVIVMDTLFGRITAHSLYSAWLNEKWRRPHLEGSLKADNGACYLELY